MNKKQMKLINNYLMNKIRVKDDSIFMEFFVFREWQENVNDGLINPDDTLQEQCYNFLLNFNNADSERKYISSYEKNNILSAVLLSFPRIGERLNNDIRNYHFFQQNHNHGSLELYHYSPCIPLIKTNGLRPSNFLNNFNDNNEVIHLLDISGITKDDTYIKIYERAILRKYNSFAYKRIDTFAKKEFLKGSCSTYDNLLSIGLDDLINSWDLSNISKNIYYGFVRYDSGTKYSVYKVLKILIEYIYPKFYRSRNFILEIVSIIITFVKNKNHPINGYDFSQEKEFRVLYDKLTAGDIPHHYIKLTSPSYRKI